MKAITSYLIISSMLLLTNAASCTSSDAISWSVGSDSTTDVDCDGDPDCVAMVAEISNTGSCMAVNAIGDGSSCSTSTSPIKQKRATSLECNISELCILYDGTTLLCLDTATGDYHNDSGGVGNAVSGAYTAANEDESEVNQQEVSEGVQSSTPSATSAVADVPSSAGGAGRTTTGQSPVAATQTNGAEYGSMARSALLAVAVLPALARIY